MNQRYIYAIATGQNQSNVPPILNLASPDGETIVVWVETELARDNKFAAHARNVLERVGIHSDPVGLPIFGSDLVSPRTLGEKLVAHMKNRAAHSDIYFVLNGGPKLAALGVEHARTKHPFALAYSDLRPVQLQVLLWGEKVFRAEPLSRALSIKDWLNLNGRELGRSSPRMVWPTPDVSTEDTSDYDRWRSDPAYQCSLARMLQLRSRDEGCVETSGTSLRSPSAGMKNDAATVEKWQRLVAETVKDAPSRHHLRMGGSFFDRAVSLVYHETLRANLPPRTMELMDQDRKWAGRWLKRIPADGRINAQDLKDFGSWYEGAVAWRVQRFFEARPEFADVVAGVWHHVETFVPGNPTPDSEFDVTILLRNAVLINLECKSMRLSRPKALEMFAKMRQVTGEGAKLVICVPLLTSVPDELHGYWLGAARNALAYAALNPGFDFLAYTGDSHDPGFVLDGWKNETFEAGLERILKPYRGTGTAHRPSGTNSNFPA